MARDRYDDLPPIEGNLARGPEPDPWSVLAPATGSSADAPSRRPAWTAVAMFLVLAVVAGAVAGAIAARAVPLQREVVQAGRETTPAVIEPGPEGVAELVEQVRPTIVSLSTKVLAASPSEAGSPVPPPGVLSGFLVDSRGYVVTAASGVADASDVTVYPGGGQQATGKVIRVFPDNDVAMVKVEQSSALPSVVLGRSADLRPGDPVVAIGRASGEASVARGVITATHRKVRDPSLDGLLQVDVALGAGFTGGVLVDLAGHVVGLIVPSPGGVGHFAIAVDHFRPFVDQVVQRKVPMTSGVKVAAMTADLAFAAGIPYFAGVMVTDLRRNGPGARVLLPGDVIQKIDGETVESEERFVRLTVTGPVERPVTLTVYRDKQFTDIPLTLEQVLARP